MRRKDMTASQLQIRDIVINMLIEVGWNMDIAIEQLFVLNNQMPCEASLFYENNELRLIVDYFAEKELIYFCIQKKFSSRINIAIEFDGNLKELLERIISFQDEVKLENYIEQVKKILFVCPKAYLDRDGEFVPLF